MTANRTAHTPGPWTACVFTEEQHLFPHVHIGKKEVWPEVDDTNRQWAVMRSPGECMHYLTINTNESQKAGTFEADAYLIAAAPELLEALSNLVSVAVENLNSTVHPEIGTAFQAIAKAEGRA